MNLLTRLLAPWFNEKRARDKEVRTEALSREALFVVSHTERVIESYRKASQTIHER